MADRFEEVVTTRERLRQIVSYPNQAIVDKVINYIDDVCRRCIAASAFAVIATKGADGLIDVSPKGDPAGFITVLDENTLAIPDHPRNKRVDSFENLFVNPEIGMIFLISGHFAMREPCPLCPQNRTSGGANGMSAKAKTDTRLIR